MGIQNRVCSICNSTGGTFVWYGLPLGSSDRIDEDEYGGGHLYERAHGQPCAHRFARRTRLTICAFAPIRSGAPPRPDLPRAFVALELMVTAHHPEWARAAWVRIRSVNEAEAHAAIMTLDEVRRSNPLPDIELWWAQNRHRLE